MARKAAAIPTFEQWSKSKEVMAKFTVLPAVIVAEHIKTRGIDLNKARVQAMRDEYDSIYGAGNED